MKKKSLKVIFVIAIAFVAGMSGYNAQETGVELSDLALENVEALASDSEGSGIPWRGYYSDWYKHCCQSGRWSDECSGSFSPCD